MDKIYIVMEYVEHDLKSLMETMKSPFLIGEVKTLMMQLLRAVAHMHDNWILHRDLKTSNLLLSHKGVLKVCQIYWSSSSLKVGISDSISVLSLVAFTMPFFPGRRLRLGSGVWFSLETLHTHCRHIVVSSAGASSRQQRVFLSHRRLERRLHLRRAPNHGTSISGEE